MNVLLTSVGRRSYLVDYFKEAMLDMDQVHCCNSEYTTSMARADGWFLSPLIYSPDYIDSIIRYCKEKDIEAVLSLFDIDLLVLAKNEDKFKANGIELVLAPYESVYLCNDKWETFKFLENIGLNTPKTYLKIEDALSAVEAGVLNYPLVIKPRWGMASMGLYFADNESELKVLFEKSRKDVFGSYLKYESELTKESCIIIQEKLVGEEYGVDVVNTLESEYFDTLAKQKVTMRAGETDVGLTVNSDGFGAIGRLLSANIKHKGILSVDVFKCNGDLFVTEMNCRISGHYPISHVAGYNFIQVLLAWLKGGVVPDVSKKYQVGVYVTKELNPVVVAGK